MEVSGTSKGTKRDERSGHPQAPARASLSKSRTILWIAAAAVCLFAGKMLVSIFLFPNGALFPPADLVLAQSPPAANPKDGAENNTGAAAPDFFKEKERALKEKEQQLKQQEAKLLPLKKEIEEKLAELNDLQASLAAYAKKLSEREKALQDVKINHLVELYSSMEPASAAAIMEKLKIETVVQILRYMKGKPAGLILAQMKPDIGASISERLSQAE